MFYILIDVHALGTLNVHEKLLSMTPNLGTRPSFNVLLDLFPILTKNIKCYIKNESIIYIRLNLNDSEEDMPNELMRYANAVIKAKKICLQSLNIFSKDT